MAICCRQYGHSPQVLIHRSRQGWWNLCSQGKWMSLSPSVKLSRHILQSVDVIVITPSLMIWSVLIKTSSCKRLIASCERPGGLLLGTATNRILSASTRDILCDRLVVVSGFPFDASTRAFLMNKLIRLAIHDRAGIYSSNNLSLKVLDRVCRNSTSLLELDPISWVHNRNQIPIDKRKSYK